jgi:hypothetical protein
VAETLEDALQAARSADPAERVNLYRDAIAQYGAPAIDAVLPWLTDPRLCRFAVRVIEKAGEVGARDRAVAVLREALDDPTVATGREDLTFHLRRLGYTVSPPRPDGAGQQPTPIPPRAGTGWPGFQAHEFETTDGTHWRSRTGTDSLTPHLLRSLRELDPRFDSWSIYHSPEVHIAVRERYRDPDDWAQGWRAAKLVVYAHGYTPERGNAPHQVTVGLYVEKGDGSPDGGPVDGRWDWPGFVRALETAPFQAKLERAMKLHGLRLGDYVGGNRFFKGGANVGFVAYPDADGLAIDVADGEAERGWEALHRRVANLPTERWHDLHLWKSWPAEDAMASGVSFARESMVPVLGDLAPLYLAIIPPGG